MDWLKEINAAVTICDTDGIIVYMNEGSAQVFESDGGKNLIGQSLFGCHPEPALTKLNELLAKGSTNIYTIEKNGKKKLIYQAPYYENNEYKGFVELSMEIPEVMENFVRG